MLKKRILLSSNSAWNIYNFRSGMIRALTDRCFVVHIAAPIDKFASSLEDMGCQFHNIEIDSKSLNPLKDMRTFFQYWRLYRRLKPDLALHYTIKPNIYGSFAARLLGIPVINSVTGLGNVFLHESWATRVAGLLYRVSQSRAQAVFFQNHEDKQLFVDRGFVAPRASRYVPGSGVDTGKFAPVPIPDKNSDFKFLFLGRMLWDKGLGELVVAAQKLKVKYPHVRVQLLGYLNVENPMAISSVTMSKWVQDGIVEYLGHTNDVSHFISKAHCIVLPSYREGLPRSLLEAAAMARPIVTTKTPGCQEVVVHDENGYLCQPKDPEDLADKMEKLLLLSEEERAVMGKKGRAKIIDEFDEKIVTAAYLSEIEGSISDRSPAHSGKR